MLIQLSTAHVFVHLMQMIFLPLHTVILQMLQMEDLQTQKHHMLLIRRGLNVGYTGK
jgi:hypothetical protein